MHRRAVLTGDHQGKLEISHLVDLHGEYRELVAPRSKEHLDASKRMKGGEISIVDDFAVHFLKVEKDLTREIVA